MGDDTKIYLTLCTIKDDRGNDVEVVSHGVGNNTLTNHCLPPEPIHSFNPKRDSEGYYIDA